MIEFFEPLIPPNVTHNDLMAVARKGGKAAIIKSAALNSVESKWESYLAKHAPQKPLEGPIVAEVRICWPTGGNHAQGEPKDTKPDLDNVEKTLWDVMQKLGYFKGDQQIVYKTTSKMWSDPAGIYVRMEEV